MRKYKVSIVGLSIHIHNDVFLFHSSCLYHSSCLFRFSCLFHSFYLYRFSFLFRSSCSSYLFLCWVVKGLLGKRRFERRLTKRNCTWTRRIVRLGWWLIRVWMVWLRLRVWLRIVGRMRIGLVRLHGMWRVLVRRSV